MMPEFCENIHANSAWYLFMAKLYTMHVTAFRTSHSPSPPVPRTTPSAPTAVGGSTRPTTVTLAHTGRVSMKSKATVARIKSWGTHWCSGHAHGTISWKWWEATIAIETTRRTNWSSSIRDEWSSSTIRGDWSSSTIWGDWSSSTTRGGFTVCCLSTACARVCFFASSSIAKATVASPACTGHNNHGRYSHQQED